MVRLEDIQWCAWTVALEAGGEPYEGQLGVAWVIVNRLTTWSTVQRVVLARVQFSCWNDRRPDAQTPMLLRPACAALFGFEPDPTHGATNYLNVELTRTQRRNHDLPAWYDPAKVTAVIGQHTFLRLNP